jgi:hypothetical protein
MVGKMESMKTTHFFKLIFGFFFLAGLGVLLHAQNNQNIETKAMNLLTEMNMNIGNYRWWLYFDKKNNKMYSVGINNGFIEADLTNFTVKEIKLIDNGVFLNMVPDLRYAKDIYDFSVTRYPYSNNTIILEGLSREDGKQGWTNYVYDLSEQKIMKEIDFLYSFYYFDSDHRYITRHVETSEYTIAIESGWCYWLIDKDNIFSSEYGDLHNELENNEFVVEIIMNEFKKTIFEDPYIFETIYQINKSLGGIITMFGCSVATNLSYILNDYNEFRDGNFDSIHNSVLAYFFTRMENYFDVNVFSELEKYKELNTPSYSNYMYLDTYQYGFYCFNNKRVTIFDIVNKEVTSCQFETLPDTNWFHITGLSPDGKQCYVQTNNSILVYSL